DWTANTVTKAISGLTASTTYWFNVLVKDQAGIKVAYTTGSQATTGPATISSAVLSSDNTYMDITFSEGVYNTNGSSGALETADFSLLYTQNGDDVTAMAISSVKKNDNSTEGSASALAGGETVIRVFLSQTAGPSSGTGTVNISAQTNSIYNAVGVATLNTQNSGTKTLTDQSLIKANDPGFESYDGSTGDSTTNWEEIGTSLDTSIIASSAIKHSGNQSVEINTPATSYASRSIKSKKFSVTVGSNYTVSGWFYVDSTGGATITNFDFRMRLEWLDSGDAPLSVSGSTTGWNIAGFNTWERVLKTTQTAPVGAVTARVYIDYKEDGSDNNKAYIDDLRVTKE
ncbi:MAG: hypothetical protein CVV64_07240, partial [Candidatus Wallbacteria bacterium HGW-Wallbacteria-1]